DIARSLASFELPPMRSQLYIFNDCQLIDDSYNANPESMKEALRLLQERGGQRKIAILGDMLELGNKAELYHYQLGKQAGESGVDALFVLGEFSKEVSRGAREAGTKNTFFFQDREKLKNELFSYLRRGDSLLVKGSRGMKMEEIVEDLKERLCCIS
ncbi:MAG TPA: UDP-N-acetylmuramoyl-tripeptide--D-alanyl-D-alanine ligase, partial [Candidatus Aerophobetes bacterium]|nr:UDP-N-acetylmuramoyl-tripeptide--D-alanyl-D-alanine ligase [Candidatus Aerophobetes bacterium]